MCYRWEHAAGSPWPRLAAAHFRYLSAELRPLWGDELRGERQLLLALQPLRLERLVDRLLQRLQRGVTYHGMSQAHARRGGYFDAHLSFLQQASLLQQHVCEVQHLTI